MLKVIMEFSGSQINILLKDKNASKPTESDLFQVSFFMALDSSYVSSPSSEDYWWLLENALNP